MKIAVTGGSGFFGSHVVERLVQGGHSVFVIDDLSRGRYNNLSDVGRQKLSLTLADFSDPRKAAEWTDMIARSGVDILIHMASPMSHNPPDHIAGLELAASYLRSLRILKIPTVYISTSSANTIPDARGMPGDIIRPEGLYGMTKAFIEWALSDLKKNGDVPNYVILRPSNLYGPREVFSGHSHIHVIPNLIRKALLGESPIEILGDGSQTRPFTYVEDGVQAIVNAIEVIRRGKTIPLALVHGPQVSIKEVVEHIMRGTKSKARVTWKKGAHIGVKSRELPPHDGKILLGWKPKVSIDEGIEQTIKWVQMNPDRLQMQELDERPFGTTLA
ncbi:MAG TPA: NAD-dependent epimerase/dehydratase family protein [Candidatus Saccharimonadales bacterium]|nr:NAD-dependent epimerase/dehydratase family protein [Candidatus Saccharimonadales bacterium]